MDVKGGTKTLPYWQVNVPEHERSDVCPDFLAELTDKDRLIVSTPDSLYQTQTWDEVREIVRANDLALFQRVPSDLRRYKAFTWKLARDYGSVTDFLLNERLGWQPPLSAKGSYPFECAEDYKVLFNDWPYGIDSRIVHLVVWTKFALEEDPQTGDLTDQARQHLRDFMADKFLSYIPETQVSAVYLYTRLLLLILTLIKVIWFKNWAALKSVNAVEHFHIMLYDPDPEFVKRITNGDIPQSLKPEA